MDYAAVTFGSGLAWLGVGLFGLVFTGARVLRHFRRNRDARANLARSLARSDRVPGPITGGQRDADTEAVPVVHFDTRTHLDRYRNGAARRLGNREAGPGADGRDLNPWDRSCDPGVPPGGECGSPDAQALR